MVSSWECWVVVVNHCRECWVVVWSVVGNDGRLWSVMGNAGRLWSVVGNAGWLGGQ